MRPDWPSIANVSPKFAIGTGDVGGAGVGDRVAVDRAAVTAAGTVARLSGLAVEVQLTAARHATKINAMCLSMVTS